MSGTCAICGEKTGFRNKFRCLDGAICKRCYQIVTNDFSSTIARLTVQDLKKTYVKNAKSFVSKQDFIRTLDK